MTDKIERIGEKFITNEGYNIEIVGYFGRSNCTIKFEDGGTIYNKTYKNIQKGSIKNRNHLVICNIGFIGYGKYNSKHHSKSYNTWKGMLNRCYDNKTQERQPTYKGCTVDERWHNFQNFAKWHEENHVENFQLDKDILVKNNKIYSPETCCFVPREINMLSTKFFKDKKEIIHKISIKYYNKNDISLKIFNILNKL